MSDLNEISDYQLVEQVRQGQAEQFNLLVLKYEHRLQRLAMRFVSDPFESKDIVQEAFIRAYQGIDSFRGDSSFFTWIYRITINTAKNYVSVKDRKMLVKCGFTDDEFDIISDKLPREEITPEHRIHLNEVEDNVMSVIEQMPEDLKVTLTLRELNGMSYQDIANVLDCPVGTIRSRLHRARNLIHLQLEQTDALSIKKDL